MPSRKISIVRNPTSGRGAGTAKWSQVESRIASLGDSAQILTTQHAGHAKDLAKQAASEGSELVVACGGDGTISEVLNGLIGSNSRLGVIPMGTGNDFCRHIGLGTDIGLAIDTLTNGTEIPIDIGHWSCEQGEGYFLNIVGCGFDAVVAKRINRGFRFVTGTSAYIAAVLSTLMKHKPVEMTIQTDQERLETSAMLCSVANSSSYGGGMRIAPDASIQDGLLDIAIVGNTGTLEFLRAFPRVFKGTHTDHPKVTMLRGRTVRIESKQPLPVLADGEIVGTTPVDFSLLPSQISLMVPNSRLNSL